MSESESETVLTQQQVVFAQARLKRGVLPEASEAEWPAEPFRSGFLQARPPHRSLP